MTLTRSSDRWKMPATIAGFGVLVIVAAILLFVPVAERPANGVIYVLLVVGAGLISPSFIADALRIWRGGGTPPPGGP